MTVELAADHLHGFRPGGKVVAGGMDADEAFAAFDKIQQGLALLGIVELELRRAFEEHASYWARFSGVKTFMSWETSTE